MQDFGKGTGEKRGLLVLFVLFAIFAFVFIGYFVGRRSKDGRCVSKRALQYEEFNRRDR